MYDSLAAVYGVLVDDELLDDDNNCRGLMLGVEDTTPRSMLLNLPLDADAAVLFVVLKSDGVYMLLLPLFSRCFPVGPPPGVVIIEKSSEFDPSDVLCVEGVRLGDKLLLLLPPKTNT